MEYYSAIKAPSAATWMDLETVILSEVKSERKRQIYDIAYMWNLKNRVQNELIYTTKIKLQM